MKSLINSCASVAFFILTPHHSSAAITTMNLTYSVFMNTASSVYPAVNFGSGTPANFSFQYDPATSPYFTGKVVTDVNGNPIFDNGNLVYDTAVAPQSSMSNESRYNIIGNITLEIDGLIWSGTGYNLIIYNNFPTLTPLDRLSFEFDLTPNSPFVEPLHNVQLSFSSNQSPLTMIGNTALPDHNSDVDSSNIGSAGFDLGPAGGGWFINSGSLTNINISTVPELGSIGFVILSSLLSLRRHRRPSFRE